MSNETNKISNGTLYIQDAEGKWEKFGEIKDIEMTEEPEHERKQAGEACRTFDMFRDEFTMTVKIKKKDARRIWRAVSPSRERLRRLRAAKRRNRERRIRRWKDRVLTTPALLRIIRKTAKEVAAPIYQVMISTRTALQKFYNDTVPALKEAIEAMTGPFLELLALPPEVFILDKSEEVDWEKAEHPQKPDEWNPEEASNDKREEEQGEHE